MRTRTILGILAALVLFGSPAAALAPGALPDTSVTNDPVARLQERLASGETTLAYDTVLGYLPSILQALKIPVSSQTLVFSRTSLQTDRIAPWAPRALYYNDDVYIGYVQGSPILEIASIDPEQGAVFYTFEQEQREKPDFSRETTTCLMCHESKAVTEGVPGVMMRSTLADRHGYPIAGVHEGPTTDRTPYANRWGGWYVTGQHGGMTHSGNTFSPLLWNEVPNRDRYKREFDMQSAGNTSDLGKFFDTKAYLNGHSDIVALMVLGHQATAHNLITLAHMQAKQALSDQEMEVSATRATLPASGYLPSSERKVEGVVTRLLRTMLFVGEAGLTGRIQGSSGFAEEFAALGPRDAAGRSLRDFDLEKRLFRYPLSFLVYSEAFDALPELVRRPFYQRLNAILTGKDAGEEWKHLSAEDRKAILEILEQTKPDFAKLKG